MSNERSLQKPYTKVDLHCHSTISDGVLSPPDVARRAASQGVDLWALTDHDEIRGIAQARETAHDLGMDFLSGVEISVTWGGRTVHIVGLGVDETHSVLVEGLAHNRSGRLRRGQSIADRLTELGISGTFEGAKALASNPEMLSRTHFARYLVDQGYASSIQNVFDQYLGDGKPAAVPMNWATLGEALHWIHSAGGVAVIAHPGRYEFERLRLDAFVKEFQALGGCGIEIYTGSHHPNEYEFYERVARQYGLHGSCGSDFHGPKEGRYDLGSMPLLPTDIPAVWDVAKIDYAK
ncbi:PHP domain-containing protein [Orrella sp. 11846]|uniref:PHP domain-containing protein n=1 Tax=Orrella sp. 11846 TaxID=3409913 RepID=UPI003B592447